MVGWADKMMRSFRLSHRHPLQNKKRRCRWIVPLHFHLPRKPRKKWLISRMRDKCRLHRSLSKAIMIRPGWQNVIIHWTEVIIKTSSDRWPKDVSKSIRPSFLLALTTRPLEVTTQKIQKLSGKSIYKCKSSRIWFRIQELTRVLTLAASSRWQECLLVTEWTCLLIHPCLLL